MMITNKPAHIIMQQLWMGLEISGDFCSISITFRSVICFLSKLRFVVISYLSALQLTSIPSQ